MVPNPMAGTRELPILRVGMVTVIFLVVVQVADRRMVIVGEWLKLNHKHGPFKASFIQRLQRQTSLVIGYGLVRL